MHQFLHLLIFVHPFVKDCVLEKNNTKLFHQESYKEYSSQSNLDNSKNSEVIKSRIKIKREITLPSVKELAKQFASNNEPNGKLLSNGSQGSKSESKLTPKSIPTIIQPVLNNDLSNPTANGGVRQTEEMNGGPGGFNRKQVHSLTARSISKEFREGLKNNSYQKVFGKADRLGSCGENDQGDVVSSRGQTSPTPSIDLKNMKKFWEGIITANSVKQK